MCKELATAYREMDFKKVEDLWRKRGAVGLLYNLVRYIRMTPQRRDFFRRIKIGGPLAEFDGLEVSNKILYRALVLSFSDFRSVRCRILFLPEENQPIPY